MSDEARHVAFGVLSLQDYYKELTQAELKERQEFAFEAAVRMRDRFLQQEVFDRMGVPVKDALELVLQAPDRNQFQALLFSKIVPNCKKLGLLDAGDGWLRKKFTELGVHPVRGPGRHRRGVRDVRPRQRGHQERLNTQLQVSVRRQCRMPPIDTRFLVAHGLRIKGFAAASERGRR